MTNSTKAKSSTAIMIGILAVGICDSGIGAASPALGYLAKAFPDVAVSLIQSVSTLPALLMALIPLVYYKLVERGVRKKTFLIWGAAIFVFGGAAPTLFHSNIWVILFWRIALGIGNGILVPLSMDLIVDFYKKSKKERMMGFMSAANGLSGVIFQTLGGILAGFGWQYCFLAYLAGIPFLLTAIILLPEPDRAAKIAASQSVDAIDKKERLPFSVIWMSICWALCEMCFIVFATNTAMTLLGEGLCGGATIGLVMSFMTATAMIGGLLFGTLFKRLRTGVIHIVCAVMVVAMAIGYFSHTLMMFTVALGLAGLFQGAGVPNAYTKNTMLVNYSKNAAAVSAMAIAMGLGIFFQPFVFALFGPYGSGRPAFLTGLFFTIGVWILWAISDKVTRKYEVVASGGAPVHTRDIVYISN